MKKKATKNVQIKEARALEKNKSQKNNHTILIFTIILLLVGAALYLRTATFDYVYCDDDKFVINVYDYNKELSNIKTSFERTLTTGSEYYRPVLISSFIIDANIGGLDPSVYRITNIILHLIGSLLVFFTLLKLKYDELPSFFLTLIFVVHPMLTPAVSWISGRNDSLITIFLLLSFISLINFFESKDNKKWIHYGLHLFTFLVALFTKEIAAFFPFLAYIYILTIRKDKPFTNNNIILGVGWFIMGIIWFGLRTAAMENTNSPDTIGWDAVVLNIPSVFAYISKAIIPIRMTPLSLFETITVVIGLILIVGITVFVILNKNIRKNYILFGALWYVFFLFPTLLVRLVDDFFDYAEHRVYLLMVGIFIVVMEIIKSLNIDFKKPLSIAIVLLLVFVLGLKAFVYQNSFEDMFGFWGSYVRTYPEESKGFYNLGLAYYTVDSLDKAERIYKKALKLDNQNIDLYINIAALYLKKNQLDLAERYALMGLRINPKNNLLNYNLGKVYYAKRQFGMAEKPFEIAVSRTPNPKWFITLGYTYMQNKKYDGAEAALNESIRLDPNDAMAWSLLGRVYYQTKDFDKAKNVSIEAIKRNPLFTDAYINLLNVYFVTKNKQAATQIVEEMKKRNLNIPNELIERINSL
jgi:tetratricopeptide (TPR) repeat protein